MWTAVLLIFLAFAAFVGATVVAALVIASLGARRGLRHDRTTDAVVTSFIRRRERRLGLGGATPPGDEDAERGGTSA